MSAEILPFDRPETPATQEMIPIEALPAIVQAAAIAAVEAYKEGERTRKNSEARAYYRVNRDRILARQRRNRALK